MLPRTTDRFPVRPWLLLGALLAGSAVVAAGGPARAADEVKSDTSLSLVPADASFYTASLRNKEQVELFRKSNAYKAIRSLPLVKDLVAKAKEKLEEKDGPLAHYKKFTEDKENQDLVALLLDAVSHDVFVYGGKGWVDFLTLAGKVNTAQQFAPLQALIGGNFAEVNNAQARAILRELQKNRELVKVPEFVLGFKIKDAKEAEKQLGRLEKLGAGLAKNFPPLKDKVKRVKAAGGDFVTVELDGGMIPWDDVDLSGIEENKGEFDELIKHVKKSKVTVSLGVKEGYILLGFSETTKDLAKLSAKGKSLADRDELKPVLKHADKKLISVSYYSKAFLAGAAAGQGNYSSIVASLKDAVGKADLKDERKKAIEKDLEALAADMKKIQPTYGAAVSFAYLTPSGIEGYSYAHERGAAYKGLNCTLQNHFGGNPIFAAATATKFDGTSYATGVKWLKKAYGHAEAIFLDMADDDTKDAYKKGAKEILPLLKRLDEATTRLLIPSLKNGGLGLVVDAKWTSKQWHKDLPEMPKAMPMPEVGLLIGISDAKKFTAAMKEYRTTLNELYEKARESAPNKDNIPEFKIPVAESEQGKHGTLYHYPIPEEAGLDKQFQPTAGVGKRVVAVALSKKHVERLMADTPLKAKNGPLARKGNVVSVCVFDWPAFVDAAAPWIEFVVPRAVITASSDDADVEKKVKEQSAAIVKQLRVGFEAFKAFKGAAWVSYVEGDALVTHSRMVIRDLPAAREEKKD
jgi:hypothetical protein